MIDVAEIGMKSHIVGADLWPILRILRKPETMPVIPDGHTVVCGLDQGKGERMFVCETVEQMRSLYYEFVASNANYIVWYHVAIIDVACAPAA